jgi:1L-myo-inositol 1-phosphate cytidylyltransferase
MPDAVVLAAGNGDRFKNGTSQSKLLQLVLGRPLILRTLASAAEAGLMSFHVVLGYQADALRTAIERGAPAGTSVRFHFNPDWHLENGVSALAVRDRVSHGPFALLMGDHLFESAVLAKLLRVPLQAEDSILAVDSRPVPKDVADEATRVRLSGDRITAIGKHLDPYDALDTGLFVCSPALFGALDLARHAGDTTLSGGIRVLARLGLMRSADIGDAAWHDIDTLGDLATAESQLLDREAVDCARGERA